jgi:ABC-type branched-subunit amino acid transport system ATPase component/ABC-type branched-subunit amino acid transport system permease subunit
MIHITSLLLGIGNGGIYAALAVALVLTYRSSGVINFATGAMALYTAYTYKFLRDGQFLVLIPGFPKTVALGTKLGFVPAALVSLVIAALLGALLYLVVFRLLRQAPQLAKTVASLGVLVIISGLVRNQVGSTPVSVGPIFGVPHRWQWGDVTLLSDRFYLALAILLLTVGLTVVYRRTRFGLLTSAVAETPTGAVVSGVSPERIALLNWMASAVVAGVGGILIAPITPLTPDAYALAVIPALAAGVIGRFTLLVPAAVAGIAIGMLQSEASTLSAQHSWLPQTGFSELIPLIVILVALLLSKRGIPARGGLLRQQLGRAPRPRAFLVPTIVGTMAGVVALLVTTGTARSAVIGTFIGAILGLSLVVVTGFAGQVSLAQLTLAGVGGFGLSGIAQSWGVPFPLAPLLAALIACVVGVVVGLPALRLRGLTLGIVTLALAYAIEACWFRNGQFVSASGAVVDPPKLFGLDLGIGIGRDFPTMEFGLLCLFTTAAIAWGVARLRTSSFGSAMLAVRANERSAAGIGVNVVFVKMAAFAIASFIAGIGGCLLAYRQTIITFQSFTALGGLAVLSTAYLAGITSVWGGVLAGIIASAGIVYFLLDKAIDVGSWFGVLSGVGLIVTLITYPEGLAGGGHKLAERLGRRFAVLRPRHAMVPTSEPLTIVPSGPDADAEPALAVEHLTVRYGGVVAVSDVSLRIDRGKVVGLIGPNGAGKTSLIDAVTGFASAEGTVRLYGEPIDQLPAHVRVRKGLARTFQALELYDDLTVEENVSAAVFSTVKEHRHRQVSAALERAGLTSVRDRHAEDLSRGERQLVSIARAYVSEPQVLLLDEPAAGLDTADSRRLGERVRDIAATGTGVLLVDHDVALVLDICDHIYVLDFGELIVEGDAATIRSDRRFAEAYLGTLQPAPAAT